LPATRNSLWIVRNNGILEMRLLRERPHSDKRAGFLGTWPSRPCRTYGVKNLRKYAEHPRDCEPRLDYPLWEPFKFNVRLNPSIIGMIAIKDQPIISLTIGLSLGLDSRACGNVRRRRFSPDDARRFPPTTEIIWFNSERCQQSATDSAMPQSGVPSARPGQSESSD
jgi:hypothetical protein